MEKTRHIIVWVLVYSLIFSSFTMTSFGAASKGKITVSKSKVTLEMNKSYQLKPKASSKGISKRGYQYKSSKAQIATVSSKGKIIAKKLGKTTITIKSKAKPSVIKKVNITVIKRKNHVIAMERGTAAKMNLGTSKVKNTEVSWSSSNKKVAKVMKNGIIKTVGNGTATITAKSKKLTGGKKIFKVKSCKRVTSEKTLRQEIQKGTKDILITANTNLNSDLTINKGVELLLAKGITLRICDGVKLKNLGTITNVVKEVYIKKNVKMNALTEESSEDGSGEPVEPPSTEPPENVDNPNMPEVPDNLGEPGNSDDPGEVVEPELPTDEVIDQTEELNPKEEEGELETEGDQSLDTEEDSVIDVIDYSNLVQGDALVLREGCTVIVGGQKVIGPAGSDAWMSLSDPIDESKIAAIWRYNGDGELVLSVWGTLTVQKNEENLLTGINIIVGGWDTIVPVVKIPSFDVFPYWRYVVVHDSTLYVGNTKLVSKADPDSTFNVSNEKEDDNRLLFRKMDGGTTAYTMGYVEINNYYSGLNLNVDGATNFFRGKQPYVKFNCDISPWTDSQMKHHDTYTSGAYPLDVANISGLVYHFELADSKEVEMIEDAAPGTKVNFMPYLGPYRMVEFIQAVDDSGRTVTLKKVMGDRAGFIMRYQFTMPSSGMFIKTYTKHFNLYKSGELVTGNPKSYYYFDSLDEAEQWFVDLTIEVDGVMYPATVEWKKMNAYDGQVDYSGFIQCPDLDGQYEFLGYIPAYVKAE